MDAAIRVITADEVRRRCGELGEVLVDCVDGGASVSFMAPLSTERAARFWSDTADDIVTGAAVVLVAELDGVLVGTTVLRPVLIENQPHRAEIGKVLVHRSARGQGIAGRIMAAAEVEAKRLGRTLLVLDTATGSTAERLYRRLGWTEAGVIPDYALWPDGRLCDTTVFWKRV